MATGRVSYITRWDVDQTYLRLETAAVRELWVRIVERPDRRRSVPGAATVLREVAAAGSRIHIISSSPRQFRSALERKLSLDRIRWDELTLDPSRLHLLPIRRYTLREQLGHRLMALLETRAQEQRSSDPSDVLPEVLVGDDAGADAFAYSLYAAVLSGRVDRSGLKRILARAHVQGARIDRCLDALAKLDHTPSVERILIHLDRQTPPSAYDPHGVRLVPFYNFWQAALVLLEDNRLRPASVVRVASAFVVRHGFDHDSLARSYLDLLRRGHAHGAAAEPLRRAVDELRGRGQPLTYLGALERTCELVARYAADPPERVVRRSGDLDFLALARGLERR